MDDPPIVAWDIGGVLLSNGWDTEHRAAAAIRFALDRAAVEARHQAVQDEFERGGMTMDEYLDFTVFFEPRAFERDVMRDYIFSCSTANEPTVAFASRIGKNSRYRMVALNNESIELNRYRVERFGLRRLFETFFTSGYTGKRKPEPDAYAQVSRMLQRPPEEIVFIDDRPENVEAALRFGFRAVRYHDLPQLRRDLATLGVEE
jgi:putative hydrolase of the HAD superfamily